MNEKSTVPSYSTAAPGKGSEDSGTLQQRVGDLQNLVKKRDQELVKLREKEIKTTKERQDLNGKYTDTQKKYDDEKAKVGKYLKEKEDALSSLRNARQLAETERHHKAKYKEDLNKLIAEK